MNAVEIEEAVCKLVEEPFNAAAFPYQFLEAFGNKPTTIKRLRKGTSNHSDIGGVLQTSNIHLATCSAGEVGDKLTELRESPATKSKKCKFILATDGEFVEAENVGAGGDGESLACSFEELPDKFAFFLELAGIKTVRAIRENAFDVKATGRLNKLYVELLRHNPDWGTEARREAMNHFMARLIFCYFAEDTGIFHDGSPFTETVQQMSEPDGSNMHEVIAHCFHAMDMRGEEREAAGIPNYARSFPYVNGGLFGGGCTPDDVPNFSKIARSYLTHIGGLDWTKINPDIFGSMIQAVADDEERGALGMHYTSVPNILKVLNPLFLDDLRDKLDKAGDRPQALRHLRKRLSRIRVFDPACGSGNFLVIAYKEMRAIEAVINERLGEADRVSAIPLTNFRGIEMRHFAAEVARLALIIAEYQCDVLHRGQQLAMVEFLPLDSQNWITCGNALRLDWLSICPPTGKGVKTKADDLFSTPLDQTEIDFENEGGETYVCGNPPYKGSQWQTRAQKDDLRGLFDSSTKKWGSLDYVAGWIGKAVEYGSAVESTSAFVTTNSIWQGRQIETLWPLIKQSHHRIVFAHTSFQWSNLASHNAGVTVAVVGLQRGTAKTARLFATDQEGEVSSRVVDSINAYLTAAPDVVVKTRSRPLSAVSSMTFGNMPNDGGYLLLTPHEVRAAHQTYRVPRGFLRRFVGSKEFSQGVIRECIWVTDKQLQEAAAHAWLVDRFALVAEQRSSSNRQTTRELASRPHSFGEVRQKGEEITIVVPGVSGEAREYLPCGMLERGKIVSNKCFALFDAPLWHMTLIVSRLHRIWIETVCVRLRTDPSYSNTLGWNTFPVPALTHQNKKDLTRCAEDILLARESHWPATIADMYDPEAMDSDYPDLRAAHDRNDETLERIYIGRRFKNDTERLEKLFEMYTAMTAKEAS